MSKKTKVITGALLSAVMLGGTISLTACSATQRQETAYTASSAYVVAHKIVVQYASGTFGTVDVNIANTLLDLDKNASDALATVDTAYANGTTVTSTANTLANDAVTALVTYLDDHKIGKTSTEGK
ncbi:hypothetical protein [Gluconobacter albidus]|uniref:hypothetical protein n=1 Tax=Gluconobacter albidus TaxID=318683 RepID=UPI000B0185F8|nr:hypothetical protein [Gluconobacter albidus]